MTPLPIPASMIPTGGPWGPATPTMIDGTVLVVGLAAVVFVTAVVAVASLAARWWHKKAAHRPGVPYLRTHSA